MRWEFVFAAGLVTGMQVDDARDQCLLLAFSVCWAVVSVLIWRGRKHRASWSLHRRRYVGAGTLVGCVGFAVLCIGQLLDPQFETLDWFAIALLLIGGLSSLHGHRQGLEQRS